MKRFVLAAWLCTAIVAIPVGSRLGQAGPGQRLSARIAAFVVLALAAVAGLTYWAGEQTEVVVLRTLDGDGTGYETRVWVVDHDGAPWVRVANPERFWFQRLARNPHIVLIRAGVERPVVARPYDNAEARAILDQAFRNRYGIVDWWYGVLLRRHAIPVRLDPAQGPATLP